MFVVNLNNDYYYYHHLLLLVPGDWHPPPRAARSPAGRGAIPCPRHNPPPAVQSPARRRTPPTALFNPRPTAARLRCNPPPARHGISRLPCNRPPPTGGQSPARPPRAVRSPACRTIPRPPATASHDPPPTAPTETVRRVILRPRAVSHSHLSAVRRGAARSTSRRRPVSRRRWPRALGPPQQHRGECWGADSAWLGVWRWVGGEGGETRDAAILLAEVFRRLFML